jgi:three-Cys-motif partner protein
VSEIRVASDGLPARVVKQHTLEKFDRHRKYCATFNTGMKNLWRRNRGYLELFAGPGLAIDEETGDEVEGCPLLAASMRRPGFNRLAFVERDEELALSLRERLRTRGLSDDRARVFPGDANDPDILAAAVAFLPNPGLVFAFIDPEDINNEWLALEFLARRRYPRLDFLINLPVNAIERAVGRGHLEPIIRVVGHDRWVPAVKRGEDIAAVIRAAYTDQLESLHFEVVRDKQITITGTARNIYDLFFASRHPRAGKFWDEIEKIEASGQRSLFD